MRNFEFKIQYIDIHILKFQNQSHETRKSKNTF